MSQDRMTAKALVTYMKHLVHVKDAVEQGLPISLFKELLPSSYSGQLEEAGEDDEVLVRDAMLCLVKDIYIQDELHHPSKDPNQWIWRLILCQNPSVVMVLRGESPYNADIRICYGCELAHDLSLSCSEHRALESFIASAPLYFGEKWT